MGEGGRRNRRKAALPSLRAALLADLAEAQRLLAAGPAAETAHLVRRRLKHAGALLRAFEPAASDLATDLRGVLVASSRCLAAARNRQALSDTAASISGSVHAATTRTAPLALNAETADIGEGRQEAMRLIAEAAARASLLPEVTADAYARALKRVRKRSLRAYRKARSDETTVSRHNWRKRLKDLIHLLEAGGATVRRRAAILRLARRADDALGTDRDLEALRETLGPSGRGEVAMVIRKRRARLWKEARALGSRMAKAPRPCAPIAEP